MVIGGGQMDLYNDSHEKVCILSGIKETCITSTLKTGDKEITFEFRKTNRYATDIKEEGYIRTDTDEFVIKQVEPSGEWYKCTGTLNVEELEGKQYPQGFETVEKTVDECLTRQSTELDGKSSGAMFPKREQSG